MSLHLFLGVMIRVKLPTLAVSLISWYDSIRAYAVAVSAVPYRWFYNGAIYGETSVQRKNTLNCGVYLCCICS
jgi:hypothetical protein